MQRISIPIAGMSCGGCVRAVREALSKVPGVQVGKVTVGSAEVTFDPAVTTPVALRAAVARAGYEPLPA
jgi:copper chaperone CopZ